MRRVSVQEACHASILAALTGTEIKFTHQRVGRATNANNEESPSRSFPSCGLNVARANCFPRRNFVAAGDRRSIVDGGSGDMPGKDVDERRLCAALQDSSRQVESVRRNRKGLDHYLYHPSFRLSTFHDLTRKWLLPPPRRLRSPRSTRSTPPSRSTTRSLTCKLFTTMPMRFLCEIRC